LTFNNKKIPVSKSIHFTGIKPSMYSSRDFLDSEIFSKSKDPGRGSIMAQAGASGFIRDTRHSVEKERRKLSSI
jgi:hypothetical protein